MARCFRGRRGFAIAFVVVAAALVLGGMHKAGPAAAQSTGGATPTPVVKAGTVTAVPVLSPAQATGAIVRTVTVTASRLGGLQPNASMSTTSGPSCSTSYSITPSGDPAAPMLHYGGSTTCTGDPAMAFLSSDSTLRKVVGGVPLEPPVSTGPHHECVTCGYSESFGDFGPAESGTTYRSYYRSVKTLAGGWYWSSWDPSTCSVSGANNETLTCTYTTDYTTSTRITCPTNYYLDKSGNSYSPTFTFGGSVSCDGNLARLTNQSDVHTMSGGVPQEPPVAASPYGECPKCSAISTGGSWGPANSGTTYRSHYHVVYQAEPGSTWTSYDANSCTANAETLTCAYPLDYTVPSPPTATPTRTPTPLPTATPSPTPTIELGGVQPQPAPPKEDWT